MPKGIFSYYRPYDSKNYRSISASEAERQQAKKRKEERIKNFTRFLDNFTIVSKGNQQIPIVQQQVRSQTNEINPTFGIHTNIPSHYGLLLDNFNPQNQSVLEKNYKSLSKQNTQNTPQTKSVPMKKGETVASMWTRITGLPWKAAREMGLSDGSYASNIEILKGLKSGQITKESLLAMIEAENAQPYEPAPQPYMMEPQTPDYQRYSLPPELFDNSTDMTPPTERENNMAALGGYYW